MFLPMEICMSIYLTTHFFFFYLWFVQRAPDLSSGHNGIWCRQNFLLFASSDPIPFSKAMRLNLFSNLNLCSYLFSANKILGGFPTRGEIDSIKWLERNSVYHIIHSRSNPIWSYNRRLIVSGMLPTYHVNCTGHAVHPYTGEKWERQCQSFQGFETTNLVN